jgi:NADH-quinone oxidoreductase subunit J
METLGQVLYTHYFMYVIMAGFVLLVAMIGAIVLTLSVRTFARAKRQQV